MKKKEKKSAEVAKRSSDASPPTELTWGEWLIQPHIVEKLKAFVYTQTLLTAVLMTVPMYPEYWMAIVNFFRGYY